MSIAQLYNIKRAVREDRSVAYKPEKLTEQGTARLCGICYTQPSKYQCATCNVPYCSLPCYRVPQHADCAQAFAEKTAREQLGGDDVSVDQEERQRTLALLWRHEQADEAPADTDEQSSRASSELDAYSTEELMHTLSPSEQRQFEQIVQHPERAARMYFDQAAEHRPWWRQSGAAHPWTPGTEHAYRAFIAKRFMIPPSSVDLQFNALALMLAYTYALYHMGIESNAHAAASMDTDDILRLYRDLAPFLFAAAHDPVAKLVLRDAEDASLYFLQLLGPRRMGHTPGKMLLQLLQDIDALVAPRVVRAADEESAYTPALYAFADIHTVLHGTLPKKKLFFYAHTFDSMPSAARTLFHAQLRAEIQRLECEEEERVHTQQIAAANRAVDGMDRRVQRLGAR
ncbi:hypothetical protein MVES1_002409 [Malassezia vespertilionis]|uniref:HIT-type domain-containing protein n=1 Tax=Malassezia vespertilionis TaxID=2020962 RepID=A0A2N1JBJ2_9BASI|nr:uncharacterized protein MVES1_002409 [Malassezia vespertilionis]PKI83913.1 hypothetical protein MVES_002277 [Malassezia vespertilionis]WFD07053.1 hypothetical protein MVES1_002409 [Malassezia vespertilionis]